MIHKREGYKYVILEPAKTWIAEDKCAGCGLPKSEWKRSTRWKCCSVACTEKYIKDCTYYGWTELRTAAIRRDKKCVKCGKTFTRVSISHPRNIYYDKYEIILEKSEPYKDKDGEWVKYTLINQSEFVVDHIQPIAIGGSEWSIENLQTLCKACNKIKTAKDIKLISIERKLTETQSRL